MKRGECTDEGLNVIANKSYWLDHQQAENRQKRQQLDNHHETQKHLRRQTYEQRQQHRRQAAAALQSDRSVDTTENSSVVSNVSSSREARMKQIVAEAVQSAMEQMRPPQPDTITSGFKAAFEDDIKSRVDSIRKTAGCTFSKGFDWDNSDLSQKEMEHWRMKLQLEEQEQEQNFSTCIGLAADFIEGICTGLGMKALATSDLSTQIDTALKEGRFNGVIKQYANMGGGQIVKNPVSGLLLTFFSVLIKNHREQSKRQTQAQPVPTTTRPVLAPAPSFVRSAPTRPNTVPVVPVPNQRTRITEEPQFGLPPSITNTIAKLSPAIMHYKNGLDATEKIEQAKEALAQNEPGPEDMFPLL